MQAPPRWLRLLNFMALLAIEMIDATLASGVDMMATLVVLLITMPMNASLPESLNSLSPLEQILAACGMIALLQFLKLRWKWTVVKMLELLGRWTGRTKLLSWARRLDAHQRHYHRL